MLNTEQKIHRLEDLLARVQRNRGRLGSIEAATEIEETASAQAATDLPPPSEPPPVRRISWVPESNAPPPSVDTPVEPEPMIVSQAAPDLEPEPTMAAPEPEPVTIIPAAPEPVVLEPEPSVLEPEPSVLEPEPSVLEPEPSVLEPELSVSEPEAIQEPEPTPEMPTETRSFEPPVQASGPVISVTGEQPRAWTLSAVLERAWCVGQSDKNKA